VASLFKINAPKIAVIKVKIVVVPEVGRGKF
jgi:hypothetical protein